MKSPNDGSVMDASPSKDKIAVQNRRRGYLEQNPSYLNSIEHELAAPGLYERLVKRFQSPEERAAEVKTKGYGRALEADLLRGEDRLAELPGSSQCSEQHGGPRSHERLKTDPETDWERTASDKTDGLKLWQSFLRDRFVQGMDEDFDYTQVDFNEEYNLIAQRDAEDAWFDDEEPSLACEPSDPCLSPRRGETGVQDF